MQRRRSCTHGTERELRCHEDGAGSAARNTHYTWLSGWWCVFTILKNMIISQWGWDDIPYMKWKIKPCSKAPTSYKWSYDRLTTNIGENLDAYGKLIGIVENGFHGISWEFHSNPRRKAKENDGKE